ncbi:MAG: hypothetical protein KGH61_00875 [Candidatus Micrarchaeota archaeon]|nr:hypothetical protein [Candidatus Micrarchaeota archaeon]MDE1847487.1 hypothetical protein [Candidatus Micrarchaeota archaeon]MDE1863877.1 hypothetical protein [Candidatus Micrarchaeota archaeon]
MDLAKIAMVSIVLLAICTGILGAAGQNAAGQTDSPGIAGSAPDVTSQPLCNDLFGATPVLGQSSSSKIQGLFGTLANYSTYNSMLEDSLLVVVVAMMVLAMIYAFGYAFGANNIIAMAKTGYLEAVLNIIIIVVLFGGVALISNAVLFLSSLGGAVISSTGVSLASSPLTTSSGITGLHEMYYSICSTYYSNAETQITNLLAMGALTYLDSIISTFTVSIMPNGFGITIVPAGGYSIPAISPISFFDPIVTGIVSMEVGIIFLLSIIYYLFPLFLFLGIFLRCIPITVAAGGALIAMFIGFYIFFPALVYPFTAVSFTCTQQCSSANPIQHDVNLGSQSILNAFPFTSALSLDPIVPTIDYFSRLVAESFFQILGIIIAFLIAYTLMETFADLLGAPSLEGKTMLRNIV